MITLKEATMTAMKLLRIHSPDHQHRSNHGSKKLSRQTTAILAHHRELLSRSCTRVLRGFFRRSFRISRLQDGHY